MKVEKLWNKSRSSLFCTTDDYWFDLGIEQAQQQDHAEAVQSFSHPLKLSPHCWQYYYN